MRTPLLNAMMSITYGARAGDFSAIRPTGIDAYWGVFRPALLMMKGAAMESFYRISG